MEYRSEVIPGLTKIYGNRVFIASSLFFVSGLFAWFYAVDYYVNIPTKTAQSTMINSEDLRNGTVIEVAFGYRCTLDQADNQAAVVKSIIEKYNENVMNLGCGHLRALQPFLLTLWDPSQAKINLVNVGANKGYNLLEWLQMWAPEINKGPNGWGTILKGKYPDQESALCGTCGDCEMDPNEFSEVRKPLKVSPKVDATETGIQLYAVEPSHVNFQLLQQLEEWVAYPNFHIIHAAASDQPGVGKFPNTSLGFTRAFLGSQGLDVNITTLDMLMEANGINHIHYLKIDAEGHDPKVIEGANSAFANKRVSLLEFEYHGLTEWKNVKLQNVVAKLDEFGYDCFLTTGRKEGDGLIRLSGCWDNTFEFKKWSNVLCSLRNDIRLNSFLIANSVWL